MDNDPSRPHTPSGPKRWVGLLFGIFLVAMAAAILIWSEPSTRTGSILAALVVGALGINEILSAMRGKRSLLARIGPLP